MVAPKSILIVEDYPEMKELMRGLLVDLGYEVFTASNGKETIDILRKKINFNLILLDLKLPDISVMDLIKVMIQEELGDRTPIVVCSAADNLSEINLPFSVVGTIRKPFDINEFMRLVVKYQRD